MREILFHGKRINNGEWVEGYCVRLNGEEHLIYNGYAETDCRDYYPDCFSVDPSSVGQFTGLADKNGKKIFEGDICKFREWCNGEMCWTGYIHFEHCQFIISGGANKECPSNFHLVLSRFSSENIEVIGNIHDNPELLEMTE